MANFSSLGARATFLASLGTVFFMLYSLGRVDASYGGIGQSGHAYVGYAVMIWLGIIILAFGWVGAAYAVKKQHFMLALTGAVFVLASCPAELLLLLSMPTQYSMVPSPVSYVSSILIFGIIFQFLLALLGVVSIAKDKDQFT